MEWNPNNRVVEFVMVYGWAILVVILAISALVYFGIVNPNKLLPCEKVYTNYEYSCQQLYWALSVGIEELPKSIYVTTCKNQTVNDGLNIVDGTIDAKFQYIHGCILKGTQK